MRKPDPMMVLFAAMGDAEAGRDIGHAIEESERNGQSELCARSRESVCDLPREIDPESKAALQAAGIKFPGNCPTDELFQKATLPFGWQIKRTDHYMWTKLCDEKGRQRAMIFYKAAFYDRSAHMSASCRFKIDSFYNSDHQTVAVARVNDQSTYPFESERFEIKTEIDNFGVYDHATGNYSTPSKRDVATKQCVAWLDEHYPNWRDPSAYWD